MKVSTQGSRLTEGLRCLCLPRPSQLNTPLRRQILHFSTKHFSTSSKRHAGISAPRINFNKFEADENANDEKDMGQQEQNVYKARLVPTSRSYFTAQPAFMDNYLELQKLVDKYSHIPAITAAEMGRVAWVSLADYRNNTGENVKSSKYSKIVALLTRLNRIHPALMPQEVKAVMKIYKRDVNPYENMAKVRTVDHLGRGLGAGRRKSSTARAWLVEGTGEVLINGKTLAEVFGRVHDRESVIWALKATNRLDKYNVWGLCSGGGTTGQAEALALAVGKALLVHEPALKPAVRRSGCVTRDPRRVERKKPGHVKARKMPAWVKR